MKQNRQYKQQYIFIIYLIFFIFFWKFVTYFDFFLFHELMVFKYLQNLNWSAQ